MEAAMILEDAEAERIRRGLVAVGYHIEVYDVE